MYCLTVNSGSSSIKLSLFDYESNKFVDELIADRLSDMKTEEREVVFKDLTAELLKKNSIDDFVQVTSVVHRVVHGGSAYTKPVIITEDVKLEIKRLIPLAPLHNSHSLQGILLTEELFKTAKQIAVFDTAYHSTQSETNKIYGLPTKLAKKENLVRYGFHGINHEYLNKVVSRELNNNELAVITCHLGGGSSVTASLNGKSVYCSMGFTPLEGVPMGTRVGDIDAGLILYLLTEKGYRAEDLAKMLWFESGILGVSGFSSDMRDILVPPAGKEREALFTLDWYASRIAAEIAKVSTNLPRLDVIAFSGGIGQNSGVVRELILNKLWQFSLGIEPKLNQINNLVFSTDTSSVALFAIPANEDLAMFNQSKVVM